MERIFELLGSTSSPTSDFSMDGHGFGYWTNYCAVKAAVEDGSVEKVREFLPKLRANFNSAQELKKIHSSNPECFGIWSENMCITYRYSSNQVSIGYNSAPTLGSTHVRNSVNKYGWDWVFSSFLEVSRLLRDAEKRALKHPRHRQL